MNQMKKNSLIMVCMLLILSSFAYADVEDLYNGIISGYTFSLTDSLNDTVSTNDFNNVLTTYNANGIIDNCREFDIADSAVINAPCNLFNGVGASRTYNVWFYPHVIDGNRHNILYDNTEDGLIRMRIGTGNKLEVVFYTGANNILYSDEVLSTNRWYMATAVYDTNFIRLYINGTLHDTGGAIGNLATSASDGNLYSGASVSSSYFDGLIDEITIYDYAMAVENVTYLYNNHAPTTAQQYPFNYNINVTYISPANNTHFNGEFNPIFNVTISTSCSLYINGTLNDTISATKNTEEQFNITFTQDECFNYYINCDDVNTSVYSACYDSVYPVITLNSPLNESIHDDNISLDIRYYDKYLYMTNTTIYNISGGNIVYTNDSGILLSEWKNLTDTLDFPIGNYSILMEATDTHTTKKIKPMNYDIVGNYLTFYDGEDYIEFYSGTTTQEPIYNEDRYIFNYCSETNKFKIKIKSNMRIDYFKDSEYPCHLIIGSKYWFDTYPYMCSEPTIEHTDEYEVEIEIENDEPIQCINTQSLGGLNYINSTTWFYTYDCTPNLLNTSWINTVNTSCSSNFSLTETFQRIQYDNNNCPQSSNTTLYTYNHTFCIYTAPSSNTTGVSADLTSLNNNSSIFLIFILWLILFGIGMYYKEITVYYFACIIGILSSIHMFINYTNFPTIVSAVFGLLNAYLIIRMLIEK